MPLSLNQKKGTGGGKRHNQGINQKAKQLFEEQLKSSGYCCAYEIRFLMETKGYGFSTCEKVPNAVQSCLFYSNIFDLEEYKRRPKDSKRAYTALRWRKSSKRKLPLSMKWDSVKKGGPIRNKDGSIRPMVIFKLRQLG